MKKTDMIYCCTILKGLYEKMLECEESIKSIMNKYRNDIDTVTKAAEEKYPLNIAPANALEMYDSEKRREREKEVAIRTDVVNGQRKLYIDAKREDLDKKAINDVLTDQNSLR